MYSYDEYKPKLLTDDGQRLVLEAYTTAQRLGDVAGAFTLFKMLRNVSYGDTFQANAIGDRLVELGYLRVVGKLHNSEPVFVLVKREA